MDTVTMLAKINELIEILTFAQKAIDGSYQAVVPQLDQLKQDRDVAQAQLADVQTQLQTVNDQLVSLQQVNPVVQNVAPL